MTYRRPPRPDSCTLPPETVNQGVALDRGQSYYPLGNHPTTSARRQHDDSTAATQCWSPSGSRSTRSWSCDAVVPAFVASCPLSLKEPVVLRLQHAGPKQSTHPSPTTADDSSHREAQTSKKAMILARAVTKQLSPPTRVPLAGMTESHL